MRNKKNKGPLPPCPDPDRFILVKTREGDFWRRKRGTVKKASLNTAFTKNARNIKVTAPAGSRIVKRLSPFLEGLDTGRLTARISGKLRKVLNHSGNIDFSLLEGFELSKEFPLDKILPVDFTVKQTRNELTVELPVHERTIKRHNRLVTDYYFDLVLLHGNPAREHGLKIDSVSSELYSFANNKKACVLSVQLPVNKSLWMVLLKVNCHEGREMASHPKHYGMRVVRVGGG